MRVTYTVGGLTFQMRTFTGRDLARVTGKLALLPTGPSDSAPAWRANEIVDGLLAVCSRVPKITLDEPTEIPEGTIPVGELADEVYLELMHNLARDSGFDAEAVEVVRPTSATVEVS